MEENGVINCHWYCHWFRNEKDSHHDHPRLQAALLISIMTISAKASNHSVVTLTTLSFQWLNDSTCSFHRHNRYIHKKTQLADIITTERGTFIKLQINQVKICLWECTQQQLRRYAPKRKRHCDETPITGCTRSYHFDNLQCSQRRNRRHCYLGEWAIWKHRHVDHPMWMLAIVVVIATTWATVSDQRVATAPRSPNQRFSIFRSQLLLQIKQSISSQS